MGWDWCSGEYDTWAETDDRCDAFHHDPRFRGGGDVLCCVPMPIRFRWSDSNHPHYLTAGKGLADGSTPDPHPFRTEQRGACEKCCKNSEVRWSHNQAPC